MNAKNIMFDERRAESEIYNLYSILKSEMPLILSSKDNHKLITQEL